MATKARYYKCYHDEALTGQRELGLAARGLYWTLIDLFWSTEGPVSKERLRNECNGHARIFNNALEEVFEKKRKLVYLTRDGLISHRRCERDLKKMKQEEQAEEAEPTENPSQPGPNSGVTLTQLSTKPAENKDSASPNQNQNQNQDLESKNLEGSGRSAPVRAVARQPTPIRDPVAYKQAGDFAKFKLVYDRVNEAAGFLDGRKREEAWQVAADAETAGSWKAMPKPAAKRLKELYGWAKIVLAKQAAD